MSSMETITCDACDVIWRTAEWQNKGGFLVFMEAEDPSESLVKVATCKKIYNYLEVCLARWTR